MPNVFDDINRKLVSLAKGVKNKADKALVINVQTASYTFVASDHKALVRQNVAGANNVTIPPNSSVPFNIGTQISVSQMGAGQVTIVAGGGVTLISAGGALKTRVQYSVLTAIKVATDTWLISGDIST